MERSGAEELPTPGDRFWAKSLSSGALLTDFFDNTVLNSKMMTLFVLDGSLDFGRHVTSGKLPRKQAQGRHLVQNSLS